MLESARQQDRRERFAQVKLSDAEGEGPILVTDARGRMRYRLADGAKSVLSTRATSGSAI
jgi:hypothetical protein